MSEQEIKTFDYKPCSNLPPEVFNTLTSAFPASNLVEVIDTDIRVTTAMMDELKTKPAAQDKKKHSKNPSDRGTRGIINKINQRLSREDITDEQFEKWVGLAVELRKRVGMAGKPKERHPRLESDQGLFDIE